MVSVNPYSDLEAAHHDLPPGAAFNIHSYIEGDHAFILMYTDGSEKIAVDSVKKAIRNPDVQLSIEGAVEICHAIYLQILYDQAHLASS